MTQLRCTLVALLGLTLAACGDDATIVSVNISYADDVAAPAKVKVSLSQGSNKTDETFDAPTNKAVVDNMTTDVPDRAYFKRYDLSGWADGEATLTVDLLDSSGTAYMTDTTKFDIEENGATAAYAEFKIEVPDETSGDSGSSDSGSSSAPSSSAGDASTSAALDSSTGDAADSSDAAAASDAADSSDAATGDAETSEGGVSSDAASSDAASTEDAQ